MINLTLVDSQKAKVWLERWFKALNARSFDELSALMDEMADPDFVLEYPQSGERIRGKENNLAVLKNYPGLPDAKLGAVRGAEDKWVLTPSWTPLRITGSGDRYSVEGRLVYPNGEVWHFVELFDLRNDKVTKLTEYFAPQFPPADWRSPWVEVEEPAREK